jgi:hypothetical protein
MLFKGTITGNSYTGSRHTLNKQKLIGIGFEVGLETRKFEN